MAYLMGWKEIERVEIDLIHKGIKTFCRRFLKILLAVV